MKRIILKITAILLIIAGMLSCGKDDKNNREPIKLKGTHWGLRGIVDVQTGTMIELELNYTECAILFFNTDTTANGCLGASRIYLHISPQQVFVVIENEDDYYTGDVKLFYDTIKTLISYTVTEDELKLYCNKEKNYLLYERFIYYN
jgi:hypothetical protein